MMRLTIHQDNIREVEVKPGELLKTYLQLTRKDVEAYFLKGAELIDCSCPACRGREREKSFKKFGLQYWECGNCKTLYISPRPAQKLIDHYYHTSEASKFWKEELSKKTEQKRKEKIFKQRIEWLTEITEEYLPSAYKFFSINTIHQPFIEELIESKAFKEIIIINPWVNLSPEYYQKDNVSIIDKPLESAGIDFKADAVSLFEVLDRISDVESFLTSLGKAMSPSGLCFLTSISISGFDLQVLWENSNSIFPPDRMNVFSLEGLTVLLERHGFECIEMSTPGLLDMEIVANAYKQNPSLELPRFIKYILDKRDTETYQSFQEFLQMNRLSSFASIVFRKKQRGI